MKTKFPDYTRCLTNVTNSILKHYGLETYHNTLKELDEILEERPYKNIVLMLYDGMGSNILKRNLKNTDFLNKNKLMDIDAVFPPTTTASTTAVLTGKNPNEHGWLGWDLYFKSIDETVTMFTNYIKDTDKLAPIENISEKTYPNTRIIESIGTKVNAISISPFSDHPYKGIDDMHNKILETINNGQENFIYAYLEDPDKTMHMNGTDSEITKNLFEELNAKTEKLCQNLKDTLLILIADHGHLNSEPINLSNYPDIFNLLKRTTSIEPRATAFFIKDDKKEAFKDLFNKYFKEDFLLLDKNEVIENKIFGTGENNSHFEEVIGDYLAIATSNKYIIYNENGPEFISAHAGITEDEVLVPLIIYKS